jgi:hypothetical protein
MESWGVAFLGVIALGSIAQTIFRRFVARPLGPLMDVAAFLKGIRRGLQVYKTLRGHDARERAPLPRYQDEDEHLFI